MNVLVACEESQRVCMAFRSYGDNAFSCDLKSCSGGFLEYHICGDCLRLLNGHCVFHTMDGKQHYIKSSWDLIIAHPPCTYLTKAGANLLFNSSHTVKSLKRFLSGLEAASFFMKFYNADCDHIVIENPVPMSIFNLPKYSQVIEPFYFGDPVHKKTCLWLKGVPALYVSDLVTPTGYIVCSDGIAKDNIPGGLKGYRSAEMRSKTSLGVASAMASQWNNLYGG